MERWFTNLQVTLKDIAVILTVNKGEIKGETEIKKLGSNANS
jgi:hypothetical protein